MVRFLTVEGRGSRVETLDESPRASARSGGGQIELHQDPHILLRTYTCRRPEQDQIPYPSQALASWATVKGILLLLSR